MVTHESKRRKRVSALVSQYEFAQLEALARTYGQPVSVVVTGLITRALLEPVDAEEVGTALDVGEPGSRKEVR